MPITDFGPVSAVSRGASVQSNRSGVKHQNQDCKI